jgi:hypothetical protein
MIHIPLRGKKGIGLYAIVDEDDYILASQFKWYLLNHKSNQYAVSNQDQLLHRLLLQPPSNMTVDHRNGNSLDCRRENMRICTRGQNNKNSSKRRTKKIGQYKGVHYWPQWAPLKKRNYNYEKPWQARIIVDKKTVELGVFVTEEAAAKAYDEAAIRAFGEFARLNFPDQKTA